ncbi:hypothetical protein AX17_002830 [Amanita inopinata Kibby_2008]|nr:hypothetical protein AX17_002830 [Amanita inopinata Kibby_2008]
MFEEVCLVCGKHLLDDGRAYCSDDCQSFDMSSPCISSASSALSSPHLGYAVGDEVPPLVPSALGRHRGRDRYSISSSSASSTSWSITTDDEDEDPALGVSTEYNQLDGIEQVSEGNTKPISNVHPLWPAALSYARLPSGTNNRSTVPQLHKRTASGSPGHVRVIPRSAPIYSHPSSAEEEEGCSDFGFSSREGLHANENSHHPFSDNDRTLSVTKSRRTRNRVSLPACFSLLQVSSSAQEARSSPVSSSSGNTIARPSPPTPKLVLSTGHTLSDIMALSPGQSLAALQATPRGRRRVPGNSRTSRRLDHPSSPSRSRSRMYGDAPCMTEAMMDVAGHRPGMRDKVEEVLNWSSEPSVSRGRNAIRRNSSPPPKMQLSTLESEASTRMRAKLRGRLRAEDLDDFSADAPGYGNGRSGLMDRERAFGIRPTEFY